MALAFDGMLDRLKEAVARPQQISADLAHELRTPIQNLMLETDASSTCALRVSDTGRGIAPEYLPKLFDRFFQVEPDHCRSLEGMGLGLSIVRSIMDLHGDGLRDALDPRLARRM